VLASRILPPAQDHFPSMVQQQAAVRLLTPRHAKAHDDVISTVLPGPEDGPNHRCYSTTIAQANNLGGFENLCTLASCPAPPHLA